MSLPTSSSADETALLPAERGVVVQRRARKWRFLSLGGGLLLAASFFMPAIESCNKPVVPVERAAEMLEVKSISDVPEAVAVFCVYVAPYLVGVFAIVGIGIRLLQLERAHRIHAMVFLFFICFVALPSFIVYSIAFGVAIYQHDSSLNAIWPASWPIILLTVVLPGIALAYLWRTRRLGGRRWMCHLVIVSAWVFSWFVFWFVGELIAGDRGYYGLHCSLLGSIMVLVATIGEAAVLTRQRYACTLWQFLIGRLASFDQHVGHCLRCGYYLFGLRDQRCPECGRVFTFEEVGVSAAELGFLGEQTVRAYNPTPSNTVHSTRR